MSHFDIQAQVVDLSLKNPFTISRGTKKSVSNVILKLSSNGITGYGEAAPNSRYNEDADAVLRFIDNLPSAFFDDLKTPEDVSDNILSLEDPVRSAQAALEMAWLDWWGKYREKPLWELWSAPYNSTPPTSFTIGLGDLEEMQRKVRQAEDFPILKVKLGTDRDREIIKAIRNFTDKTIRVDANEGWKSIDEAKEMITFLDNHHIEIVEQPMPASNKKELREIKRWSPLPIFADESFQDDEDLDEIAEQFHGINIKLMKIGSLIKARNVIQQARKCNLDVMVGCMVESSLAISAGAHIGTWAEYVDLDGNLLIGNDPFRGLELDHQKKIILSKNPGLGVVPT